MSERREDFEARPGFVRWATPEELKDQPLPPGRAASAWAWFDTLSGWRVPTDTEKRRHCSGQRCVAKNGPRPVVALLTRVHSTAAGRRPWRHVFCAEHAAEFAQHVVDGRVLWLRGFHGDDR